MPRPKEGPPGGPGPTSGESQGTGVTCRLATVEDLDRVSAFMRRAAGVDIPPQYWRWRYFDNPAGPSGIVIALDADQVVGLMSAFAAPFRLRGVQLVASQMGHNDVLKSYRAANVYFLLSTVVFRELVDQRGIDFCFGIAIKETRDLSTVLMGFDEVGPIGKMVKIINPVPHLRKKLNLPLPRALGTPAAMRTRGAVSRALHEFRVARFDHFVEVDDGEGREALPGHLMASRDGSYMEWRYVDCPVQQYEKLQLRSGGDLLGWVVYHRYEEQGVRYGVLDECFSARGVDLGPLVNMAVGGCLEQDVDAIVAWAPPCTALHRALREKGFAPRPSPRSLIVRRMTDRISESVLGAEDSWYYTIGDTEYWLFPVRQDWEGH